jgi:translation initiation factor 3 subunit L
MAYDGGRDYGGGYDDSYDDRPEFRDGFRDLQPPEPGLDTATYVPDVVKTFVVYLYRHIREKNVYEIHQMYEGSFQKLSDRLFKQSSWPHVDMIAAYVENDHVFCLLYKEMWFRHVYARLQPTLEQRCDSWDNYCNLFQVILHGNVNMQLPNQWLWDMVDEFIYQFQSFCQYRAKLKQKTEHELAVLRQIDEVRPLLLSLLAALHLLVKCLACLLGLPLSVVAVYAASCGYSGFRVKLPPRIHAMAGRNGRQLLECGARVWDEVGVEIL